MVRPNPKGAADRVRPQSMAFRRWARGAGLLVLVAASLPILLTLHYAVLPPPISSLMVERLVQGQALDYRWKPLRSISPELARAVIAAEDARFCRHQGVDWGAMQEVVEDAFEGGEQPLRGASTIAMQTAKNLFLWEGRSILRKAVEMPLALWIDAVWPKRRLIEVYLNIVEWGPGIYGAEAAARRHFGKSAAKLSRREAALLAAVLPNPLKRNAGKPSPAVRRKADLIQQRMGSLGGLATCAES
ncbi:MAG TPA: monofunctional biosynthetic peptidoglycan transglycosylase [Aestuariivirgaceae bacterium]